jgi:site-specific recombinase XerD
MPVFINENEFELIAKNITRKRVHQICVTAFYTGMRLGEVLHVTWEQVDLNNRMINLNNSESFVTKSKKPRCIPMCEKVYNIFKSLNDTYKPGYDIKDNIVFYKYYGIPYASSYLSHHFKETLSKTGLRKGIKFHTLRHSFASMLVSKRVSLYVVKELLGHSDFATTQIYAHLESKSLKDAIDKLNG